MLGDILRREVQAHNVSFSIVEPGFLSTALTKKTSQRNQAIFELTMNHEDKEYDSSGHTTTAGISNEERWTYPHIYDTDYVRLETAMMNHGGGHAGDGPSD
jgi:hypothetical protein